MSNLYAMRRANGDWFSINHQGRLRIPIYGTRNMAWDAHARYSGMLLFKPLMLDESRIAELAATDNQAEARFWLVESSFHNPMQGKLLEFAELTSLIRSTPQQKKGS